MASTGHKAGAVNPLVPFKTPFAYNVGVSYESWEVGRAGYSISADLDQIYENFRLIRTYHDAAVGTSDPSNPIIDHTQKAVIDWIVAHPGMELVMGTNNNAVAQGGYGTPWSAGLMTSRSYTDAWVKMVLDAFGGVAQVKAALKAILIGNELDMNGPPPSDMGNFAAYMNSWIPQSFDNLRASLEAAGLGAIPISTTIANYGPVNLISVNIPAHIVANWGAAWNNGEPFVLFNQYTGDGQKSTDYAPVEKYFASVEAALGAKLEVFIGETGYSTDWGAASQASVYKQMFDWLEGHRAESGGKTVPLFFFDAFDRPAFPLGEAGYGVYATGANSQPNGLKADLAGIFPKWTTRAATQASGDSEALYGGAGKQTIRAGAGDDIVLGLGGADKLFGEAGFDVLMGNAGRDKLVGGPGMDYLDGGKGADWLNGGRGDDTLVGGRGSDVFVLAANRGRDLILDYRDGRDRIALKGDLRFDVLDFVAMNGGTEIRAGGTAIGFVEGIRPGAFGTDDFLHL